MRRGEKMTYQIGVLFVGVLGAVATTTISGLYAVNQNLAPLKGVISTEKEFETESLLILYLVENNPMENCKYIQQV